MKISQNEFKKNLKSLLLSVTQTDKGTYRIPIGKLILKLMKNFQIVVIQDMERIFLSFENKVYRIINIDIGLPEYGHGLSHSPQYRIYELELL